MEDYKPNSHRFREEQKESTGERKKVQKIVKSTVKTKNRSGTRKLADIFVSEDAASVKSYVFMEVFVPAIKKLISDIVTDGIDIVLYGGTNRNKRGSGPSSYVSYSKYSDSRDSHSYPSENRTRSGYSIKDIVIYNRGEAEDVLRQLDALMDEYNIVRVADLYDLVGVTGNYTDNDYGWTNIRNAKIVRTRDGGYLIDMPRAMPLK